MSPAIRMAAVNKKELARKVAEELGFTYQVGGVIVDAVLNAIEEEVALGHAVKIIGHGTYKPVHCKTRSARNPQTGELLEIPAHTVPRFSAGAGFKERVHSTLVRRS